MRMVVMARGFGLAMMDSDDDDDESKDEEDAESDTSRKGTEMEAAMADLRSRCCDIESADATEQLSPIIVRSTTVARVMMRLIMVAVISRLCATDHRYHRKGCF